MCADIMARVTGATPAAQPATLTGFRRHPVQGEDYPGILPDAAGEVAGTLYSDLPESAWARLDAFEGSEYDRERVLVHTQDGNAETAWCYVFKAALASRLAPGEWLPTDFGPEARARFEARYLGFGRLPGTHDRGVD